MGNLRTGARIVTFAATLLWETSPTLLTAILFMQLVNAITPVVIVTLTRWMVDGISSYGNSIHNTLPMDLRYGALLLIMCYAIQTVSSELGSLLQGIARSRLEYVVNCKINDKINEDLGLTVFETPTLYDELVFLSRDAAIGPYAALHSFTQLMGNTITLSSLLMLVTRFGVVAPLVLLGAFLPAMLSQSKIISIGWNGILEQTPLLKSINYIGRSLLSQDFAKEIRLYHAYHWIRDQYCRLYDEVLKRGTNTKAREVAANLFYQLLSWICVAGLFIVVIDKALMKRLTLGDVVLFTNAFVQIRGLLSNMIYNFGHLERIKRGMTKLYDFLHSTPGGRITQPRPAVTIDSDFPFHIELKDVCFSYPGSKAVAIDQVSLVINPGETIALVGENGAGKTTLVKLLLRLFDPTSGTVSINGHDLKSIDLVDYRLHTAAVFQDFARPQLRLRESISFGSDKRTEAIARAAERAGLKDVLNAHGLEVQLGKQFEGGIDLSGGQWQKVALARALLRDDAKLLVLDEPSGSLDPKAEYELFQHFKAMAHGRTSILVSHRFSTVKVADRIIVFQQGKIVEQGSHAELLSKGGLYSEMYSLQAEAYQEQH